MDNVYRERVAGIRERVCILKDRRGEHDDLYARRKCAEWIDYRRKSDHDVLTVVSGYPNPTPTEAADRE